MAYDWDDRSIPVEYVLEMWHLTNMTIKCVIHVMQDFLTKAISLIERGIEVADNVYNKPKSHLSPANVQRGTSYLNQRSQRTFRVPNVRNQSG